MIGGKFTKDEIKALEPIPQGVYYSDEHDNFYDAATHNGKGEPFFQMWHTRWKEFPQDPDGIVVSPADLLAKMAETYRERNAVYGDNWRTVGQVMLSLYPDGVHLDTAKAFNEWHLFELIVVKLTRFANSGRTHADSIHDIAVYAAMIEAAILEKEKGK